MCIAHLRANSVLTPRRTEAAPDSYKRPQAVSRRPRPPHEQRPCPNKPCHPSGGVTGKDLHQPHMMREPTAWRHPAARGVGGRPSRRAHACSPSLPPEPGEWEGVVGHPVVEGGFDGADAPPIPLRKPREGRGAHRRKAAPGNGLTTLGTLLGAPPPKPPSSVVGGAVTE